MRSRTLPSGLAQAPHPQQGRQVSRGLSMLQRLSPDPHPCTLPHSSKGLHWQGALQLCRGMCLMGGGLAPILHTGAVLLP